MNSRQLNAAEMTQHRAGPFSSTQQEVTHEDMTTTGQIDFRRKSNNSTSSNGSDQSQQPLEQHRVRSHTDRAAFARFLLDGANDQNQWTNDLNNDDTSISSDRIIEKARDYQQELFEKAKADNLIAVLDTGSGKTLIACLLVRHTLAKELVRRSQRMRRRIIVFMANSVHLVRQQANVLAHNLSISPAVLCGDEKVEIWRHKDFWASVLKDNIPIVCTPAIIQQCLDGAMLSIDQISMLIFDEAHHAKKNHPYSRIMRSHYFKCDRSQRPHVFGMTASPIDSKGDVHMSAANLEELLDSKIITTSDMSILSFAPKPEDVIWTYGKPEQPKQTDLYQKLYQLCHSQEDFRRGFVFADYALVELGSWCADQVWKYIVDISETGMASMIKRYEQSSTYLNIESVKERETELKKLEEAYTLITQSLLRTFYPDETSLHPKVRRLQYEISARYKADPDIRGIVFVDRRLAALTLHDCIQKFNINNVRPGVLLGASTEKSIPKQHRESLKLFKAGLINLIFATSVADEGIDIPQCNLCIRFDLYKTPIQYMQSRGRARMARSIYAHMIEEGDLAQKNAVQYVIDSDIYIKQFCRGLPPDRLLGQGTQLQRLIAQDSSNKSFRTGDGVICDFGNCLQILSNFAASLRHVGAVEREIYEEYIVEETSQFQYTVKLPLYSETRARGAIGDLRFSKQLAKRSAAFNCCFFLRRKGLLDEQLQSIYRKVKPINHNAHLAVSEKKSSYTMNVKPTIWSRTIDITPVKLFHTVINFNPKRELCHPLAPVVLFTRHRLPDLPAFDVFVEDDVQTNVQFLQSDLKVQVSPDELKLLTTFTLNGIFVDVFNKHYSNDPMKVTYWLAPANPSWKPSSLQLDDIVDMQALHQVLSGRLKWSPNSNIAKDWSYRFICDPRSGNFRYFSKNIATGVKAHDPVPDSVPHVAQKSRNSIVDFSDSYWKASKKNFAAATWDGNQPVLHANLSQAKRNFLDPSIKPQSAYVKCYIAPQPLEVSKLDPTFAASCLIWPAIIHKIEAYMIALEGVEQIGLRGIPAELALEAFTKDSNAEDSGQDHFRGNRGMGKNYERLEFLGDSLLKMMTTITVFLRTNCDEEGMHCRRMEVICNRRLFEVSTVKYDLSKFMRTTGFNRVTWYPEHLVLLKGRGAKNPPEAVRHLEAEHALSMKTIADVSEALIGAAVMATRYLPSRFDLGIEAITLLVDSPDHAIKSWSEIISIYQPPVWSLALNDVVANQLATQVEEKTGYAFKHPRLLRSAFTHSSDMSSTVPDLQRLEFLGDAVLDWVSISWLFNTNPNRNPQWLTEHKMAMVSNKFLAALAATLDFDKFIQTSAINVLSDIGTYAHKVRARMAAPDLVPEFWTEIDSPPKALSDLIESYLGAVLVDSEFDYYEVEKFFNKHVLWFFRDITRYDGFASRHPTSYLHKKLHDEYKCRNFRILSSEPNSGRIETSITAGVLVHGQVVASAEAGNARVAKVKASKIALDIIEGMTREDFIARFLCDCVVKDD